MVRSIEFEGVDYVLTQGPVPVTQPGDVVLMTPANVTALCERLRQYTRNNGPKRDFYAAKLAAFEELERKI